MNELSVEINAIDKFRYKLLMDERSEATVSKYTHDVKCFFEHLGGRRVSREEVLSYKEHLGSRPKSAIISHSKAEKQSKTTPTTFCADLGVGRST